MCRLLSSFISARLVSWTHRMTSILQNLYFLNEGRCFTCYFYFILLRNRSHSGSSCDCCFHFHNLQAPGSIGAPAASKAGLTGVTCCSLILLLDGQLFVMNDTVGTRGGSFKCDDLWQPCRIPAAAWGATWDPAGLLSSQAATSNASDAAFCRQASRDNRWGRFT